MPSSTFSFCNTSFESYNFSSEDYFGYITLTLCLVFPRLVQS
jgi:hypothetical protein